jgi:hypothetical protein
LNNAVLSILITGGFVLILVLSLLWQRKGLRGQDIALRRQQEAMARVDETLALTRRSVELQERALALAEESAQNGREMVALLRRLAERGEG